MKSRINRTGANVLKQEAKGLQALASRIGTDALFATVVDSLSNRRIVFTSGVGKSGHICRKIAATMTSLGTPAMFIHPTEAAHGDMGIMSENDALLVMSRSGKAGELYPLVERAVLLGMPTALISECNDKYLALSVDETIKLPAVAEAWGHAPTTSTIMQMALGDAIAVALAEINGFTEEDFRATHPGGALGSGN